MTINHVLMELNFREGESITSPHNTALSIRKTALGASAAILNNVDKATQADDRVVQVMRKQLFSLTESCLIALGKSEKDEELVETLAVLFELLERVQSESIK